MKVWKLAASILVLGTVVISPKANAQNLLNPQQLSPLQNLVTPNSKDVDTYLTKGVKKLESKDFRGAIGDFNKIIEIDPNNSYAYLGRGLSRLGLASYQGAKKDFDKALEITPNMAYAHFFRGLTLVILDDRQGAIADLEKASTLFKEEGEDEFAQTADSAVTYIKSIEKLS